MSGVDDKSLYVPCCFATDAELFKAMQDFSVLLGHSISDIELSEPCILRINNIHLVFGLKKPDMQVKMAAAT